MRRLGLSSLVVLGLAVGLGWVLRGEIAVRVMSTVVERNLAADPIAELGDGLHVVLCGAGGPLPDRSRSRPCVAVVAGDALYVVDAGSGAARNLARVGLPPARVEGVLLTHFHSDHIDGVGELVMQRWTGGSHRLPLPLHGAEGVDEIAEGFNRAYRLDAVYRTAHHGAGTVPPSGSGFRAQRFPEPAPGESTVVIERDGLRVTAFKVDHPPIVPAVGVSGLPAKGLPGEFVPAR